MSLNVILHPLVFLNISDHHTRAKVKTKTVGRVIGCLFGKQTGRNLEVFNSFEVPINSCEGRVEIKDHFIKTQSDQLKQLFPDFEVVGWYSTSNTSEPNSSDIELPSLASLSLSSLTSVHKFIQKYNLNPIYLILNVTAPPGRDLPLSIFEGTTQVVQTQSALIFQKANYQIASLPAERVAVEGVAKSHEVEGDTSKYVLAMIQPLNAIKMLLVQLRTLAKMIAAEPALKTDQDFLRKLNNILSRVPLITSPILAGEEKVELAEVALVNEITMMAKTLEVLQEAADKYNTLGFK